MIPYKWEETDEQYLAIVKPRELFVEGSIFEKGRHKYETEWSDILKEHLEQDVYSFGFLKKWCFLEFARKNVLWINDAITWRPEKDNKRKQIV